MTRYDAVVVGSGPGGSVTARELARRGQSVLMLEEGDWVEPGAVPPYSMEQMRRQYRNQGMTVALGRTPIAYTEGACAGGGSEVNSGLYHRPSPELLDQWSRDHEIVELNAQILEPWHLRVEERLHVTERPQAALPAASEVLRRGAEELGWAGFDVPRWARYAVTNDGLQLEKQTMMRTYLADALDAGGEFRARSRVDSVVIQGGRATGVKVGGEFVSAHRVVVSAGATQTPALLQRSGVRHRVGSRFALHPTVKVVAEFDEQINDPTDVSTFQVKEFGPWLTLGGSASRESLVALSLVDNWSRFGESLRRWRSQSVYYASIQGRGWGRVQALPGFRDPLVVYQLHREELAMLRSGLARLMHLLLASGARQLLPSYTGAPVVRSSAEVPAAVRLLTGATASLMSVHLFGTSSMGEDPRRSVTDSFGRVHGIHDLFVNDASLLPSAPGINPQGTLMAVAHRNVAKMLEE